MASLFAGAGLQWDSLGQEASQYFTEVCIGPNITAQDGKRNTHSRGP